MRDSTAQVGAVAAHRIAAVECVLLPMQPRAVTLQAMIRPAAIRGLIRAGDDCSCKRSLRLPAPQPPAPSRFPRPVASLPLLRGVRWGILLGGLGGSVGCGVTRLDVIAENSGDLISNGGGDGGGDSDGGSDSNSHATSGGTGGTGGGDFAETGGTSGQVVSFPVNQTWPECLQGTTPDYGDYHLRLRSTQACLAAGAETVLAEYRQNPINGYFVDTVFPCVTSNSQNWTISSYMGVQYNSMLINVATDNALDVKFQGVTAGTEIVLYDVTFGANQQYTFNARTDGTYGIENKNAEGFCVTASNGGVEIQPCDPADSRQGWEFIPEYCAERAVGE